MSHSRRSRSHSIKKNPRTFKSGRVTRNPFLNFLRDFRKSNGGLKLTELTRRGAEVWRKMNDRQRSPYCHLARQAPRRRNMRRRRRARSKGRRRGRKRMVPKDPPRESDHHREQERNDGRYDREKDKGRCEEVEIRVRDPDDPDNDQNSVEIID